MPKLTYGQSANISLFYETDQPSSKVRFGGIRQFSLGDDGSVYLLELGNRLSKYSSGGQLIYRFELNHPSFPESYSINNFRVDAENNVYVAVSGLASPGLTYKVEPDGRLVISAYSDSTDLSTAIRDPAGNTFYMEANSNSLNVVKINSRGVRFEIPFDMSVLPEGREFRRVKLQAVDQYSNVYFLAGSSVSKILKMNSEEQFFLLDELVTHGANYQMPSLRSLSVNSFGELFLLDNTFSYTFDERGEENWRVFKWSPPGLVQQILDVTGDGTGYIKNTVTGTIGHYKHEFDIEGNPLGQPYDSVTDSLGNVYVIGRISHNLFKIARDGAIELIVEGAPDPSITQFSYPVQIEIDSNNNLYVLSYGLGRDKIFKIATAPIDGVSMLFTSMLSDRSATRFTFYITIEFGDDTDNALGLLHAKQILSGLGGDDELYLGARYSYLLGGDGDDSALYQYDSFDYALSQNPLTGDTEVVSKNGDNLALVLGDVETHQFRDQNISNIEVGYWGESNMPSNATEQPIYRFFNTKNKSFFYSASAAEAENILEKSSELQNSDSEWSYVYQGATFSAAHSYPDAVYVHRFYNSKTGHHFFTVNDDEVDYINQQISDANWPFVYEGAAFKVYPWDPNESEDGLEVAVHRFYSSVYNRHVFTASPLEALLFNESTQWGYEGVAFYGEKVQ